jgi:hypothetical protein
MSLVFQRNCRKFRRRADLAGPTAVHERPGVSLRKTATSIAPKQAHFLYRLSSIFFPSSASKGSVGAYPATAAGKWEGWLTG